MSKVYTRAEAENNAVHKDWGTLMWLASGAIGNAEGHTLGQVTIKQGCENPAHTHFTCEESLYLLQGRLNHAVGEESVILEPGDTLVVPAGIPHNACSIGNVDAVMIVAYASADRDFVASA